ncbi:MAG TPA: NifU family protein [Terracidiphilus sp.]
MANDGEFQQRVRQLGQLIAHFDQLPESPQKVAARELVQLLMEVHGTGLERMMEIIFESGDSGQGVIDQLGQDSAVGSLLLLYSLHPDDLETRLHKAIERMRPRLRKLGCTAELERTDAAAVEIRLTHTGHSCGSSSKDLRAIVEDSVYEFAPDVGSLEILGLAEPSSGGFVALENLLGHGLVGVAPGGRPLQMEDD